MSAVRDLAENRVVDGVYAVLKKEKLRTRSGAPYLALELGDPSGRISGRVWSDVELLDARFGEGDAVHVLGRVEKFRDRLQLEVRALEPADADPAELAPAMRRDADELDGFVECSRREIHDAALRELVARVLARPRRCARIRRRPTATTPTRAACSSTPSAWRRSATGRAAASAPARRPAARGGARARRRPDASSSARRPRSARPRRGGCSGTCTSGCGCSRRRRRTVGRAAARGRRTPRPPCRAHGRGLRALPREPARRRRGDAADPGIGPALALAASLAWGFADFFGPLKGRTLGRAARALHRADRGPRRDRARGADPRRGPASAAVLWAIPASVSGTLGLWAYYRGMAVGAMSVVAPIAGISAIVPVTVGLATGDHPSPAQIARDLRRADRRRPRVARASGGPAVAWPRASGWR